MRSKAFTLLEVLLVIVLLVGAFYPLLQMFSSGLLVSSEVKDTNTAVTLAQKKIEEIKNTAFADITNEAKATVSGYSAYQREVVITSTGTTLKDVKVIVFWTAGDGGEMCTTLETIISDF
jgi:Tfp pilus assembly protein PilV